MRDQGKEPGAEVITGLERISRCFARTAQERRPAFVSFLTAGDPDYELSCRLFAQAAMCGVDVIEIGMPFSDPVADGPAIQAANVRALEGGMRTQKVLELAARLRHSYPDIPLIVMGYANPIEVFGVERFVAAAARVGIDGLIVVDLPPEEAEVLSAAMARAGLALIRLVTPTSDASRRAQILCDASGFLYYVSVLGITGARSGSLSEIEAACMALRSASALPVVVGFGIKTAEQAAEIGRCADGVVVGSALVRLIAQAQAEAWSEERLLAQLGAFITQTAKALRTARMAPAARS